MYWRRTFPGRRDQAHAAREFVTALLPDRSRLDEVLLAVGELVANALRHSASGQGGSFAVGVRHAAGCTAVSVADEGGRAEPVVTDADDLAESGRGLRTVSLLADSWGWHGDDTGRTVTVIFAAEAPGTTPGSEPASADEDDEPTLPLIATVDEPARVHADGLTAGKP
ncbi:ATP-binding protein [Actinoallomurus sp. NPDC050550]|uniref:ATP-binding protein n=1 Tax=Actinoallomurus sp. NPDC050550 TaxID=3154937 RepID=UPI0033CD2899